MDKLTYIEYWKGAFAKCFVAGDSAECWQWAGGRNKYGYGKFRVIPPMLAHNFAYIMAYGLIPERHRVVQSCRNDLCVNPGHLRAVVGRFEPYWNSAMTQELANQIRAEYEVFKSQWETYIGRVAEARYTRRSGMYAPFPTDRPTGGSVAALARKYGLAYGTAYAICNGRSWNR